MVPLQERKRIKRQTVLDAVLEHDVGDNTLELGKGQMTQMQDNDGNRKDPVIVYTSFYSIQCALISWLAIVAG